MTFDISIVNPWSPGLLILVGIMVGGTALIWFIGSSVRDDGLGTALFGFGVVWFFASLILGSVALLIMDEAAVRGRIEQAIEAEGYDNIVLTGDEWVGSTDDGQYVEGFIRKSGADTYTVVVLEP